MALPTGTSSGHSKAFIKLFKKLKKQTQLDAVEACHQWRDNPGYPSLKFGRVQNTKARAFRLSIGDHYRALAVHEKFGSQDYYQWFWIGTHEEYNRMIKKI